MILDVGAGHFPIQGAITLDIDRSAKPEVIGSCDAMPFQSSTFDFVYMMDVLEHISPLATMKEIRRVTKEGGKLVLRTPNVMYLGCLIRYCFKGRYHTHIHHMQTFSNFELENLARASNFLTFRCYYGRVASRWKDGYSTLEKVSVFVSRFLPRFSEEVYLEAS